MDEDPAPKLAEKAEGGTGTGNPYKSTKKGAFHTFLGRPMAKAQRAAMRSLNATVPKVRQYVRWSEMPVQWSRDDHPEHIPDGYYAMEVNLLIQGYEFSKYEASPMELLLYFGLFTTYIHGKQRLGPLYHEIGAGRPVAGVSTYRSRILASVNTPCVSVKKAMPGTYKYCMYQPFITPIHIC
jgi:hypothetical protein